MTNTFPYYQTPCFFLFQLVPFVDVCVHLLKRPDLVPGPIPAYRITQALLAFVTTSNRNARQYVFRFCLQFIIFLIQGCGW